MNPRAWWRAAILALAGMVLACAGTPEIGWTPTDRLADELWAALQWGDAERAQALAAELDEPGLRARARYDLLALRHGAPAALAAARADGHPLALRYRSSREQARVELDALDPAEPALWLEELRLSAAPERREALLDRAPRVGAVEALAWAVEGWQARGEWARAEALLEGAPDSRRLDLARRRQLVGSGRPLAATDALLEDLRADRAVPESLALLHELLAARPDREREARVRAALDAPAGRPDVLAASRSRLRLHALLCAREGRLEEELAARARLAAGSAEEHARAERLRARRDPERPALTDEQRLDRAHDRPGHPALARLRLADEWALAARLQYAGLAEQPAGDWDDFALALDAAAVHLPGAPRLAGLPVRDYGFVGRALDVSAAAERFPGWLLVGGKALGLPPMLAVYDLLETRERELERGGSYLECHVRSLRVPSWLGWRGLRFAGAGLERFVFLDHDALRDADDPRDLPLAPEPLAAWPAAGREERRALDEPLDAALRVARAARADAGDHWFALRLQSLAEHEQRHIVDTRAFLESGLLGKLGALLGAGLLPGDVRAELERRAQLEALRRAEDPRIPLAEALAVLPLEGARRASEHARGYAALVADLVTLVDRGGVLGEDELAALGLRRDRRLVQQLHLLPPEAVRRLALALD